MKEPAFPTGTGITPYKSGMTLRDYFAAKAMQALIQHHYFDVAAKKSYEVADAMLKARKE
jgi:hypothetical protein